MKKIIIAVAIVSGGVALASAFWLHVNDLEEKRYRAWKVSQ